MAVKALYEYDHPSRDRIENFGEDQLLYVHWLDNPLFCSAAAFRAPRTMPFGTFVSDMVVPWARSDPDFDPASISRWFLGDEPIDASSSEQTLEELGVGHKGLLKFRTS